MKIQKVIYKKLIFFIFLCLYDESKGICPVGCGCIIAKGRLVVTRSGSIPNLINCMTSFTRKKEDSRPAMLLKMAFIQEGSGDYSEALYYLNEYYLMTSDERVISKMQHLSDEHHLQGYDYDDYDLFLNFFRKYHFVFLYGLLTLLMAGLIYFAFWGKKTSDKPYGFGITYVILLGLLFLITNFSLGPEKAIITADHTYIMNGPSPGAKVLYVSEKGHRVKVRGQKDVWTKIEWKASLHT